MRKKYETREACFVCTTPYQILGAISIVRSENIDADMYVFGTFSGYEEIAGKLREQKLFGHVYSVDCEEMSFFGKGMSQAKAKLKILQQMAFPERCFKGVLEKDVAYSRFYSSSRAHAKVLLQRILQKRNPDMRTTIYDDGLGSYLEDSHVLKTSRDRQIMERLLGWHLFDPGKVDIELYLPSIAQIPEELEGCPVKEMPLLDWGHGEAKRIINAVFGKAGEEVQDGKIILFDNVRGLTSRRQMFEKIDECYREIISLAGKENVLFKGHPRSMEEPAIEMNRVTGSVPMEVFYSNMDDLEGKVLVAYNSTATYTPKLLFGKEPRVINLHRIVGGPMQQNSETLYRTFLPTYEDKGRLLAPETTEELRQMITDIMKEEKQP